MAGAFALPDEIVEAILWRITPFGHDTSFQALSRCRAISKQFHRVATQDKLWAAHFKWKHGRSLDTFDSAMEGCAARYTIDKSVDDSIEYFLNNACHRLDHFNRLNMNCYDRLAELNAYLNISSLSWKAKQKRCSQWLSRSFWVKEMTGFTLRREAVKTLTQISHTPQLVSFERGLILFCLFRNADPLDIEEELDRLARKCLPSVSQSIENGDLLATAQQVRDFMVSEGLEAASAEDFHMLENNFVNVVLLEKRPSLPMTLVWIFTSLCSRLGVAAYSVGFPSTVLALIAGWKDPAKARQDAFYFNLFHNRVATRAQLVIDLFTANVAPENQAVLLNPANTRDIVLRSARNIYNSLGLVQEQIPIPQERDKLLSSAYASATTLIMLSQARQGRQLADLLSNIVEERFPFDAPFLFREINEGSTANDCFGSRLQTAAFESKTIDEVGQEVKRRHRNGVTIKYSVGSIFRHRHYIYTAVIIGHDSICRASTEWQRAMRLEDLDRGADQPFYNVLVDDGSSRYVAEDNIDLLKKADDGILETLVHLQPNLGKFFHDFDEDSCQFVRSADLTQEYPES